jgi:hypothetical protein
MKAWFSLTSSITLTAASSEKLGTETMQISPLLNT